MIYKSERKKVINPFFTCNVCKKPLIVDKYCAVISSTTTKDLHSMFQTELCLSPKCYTFYILQHI